MAETITGNVIQNCNPSGIPWGWTPTFEPAPPQILIAGNTIIDSAQDGIFLFSQGPGGFISPAPFSLKPDVLYNQLLNNGGAGINISNFYFYSLGNANPRIHCNCIVGNTQFGILNSTAGKVDATDNWWGNPGGPFHPTLNSQGTRDAVSNNVLFSPWKDIPPPQEMDYLVMEKVFGQCFMKNTIVKTFIIPASRNDPYENANLTKVDRVEGATLTAKCTVAEVSPPLNANQRLIIVRHMLEIKIDLVDEMPAQPVVLCPFNETINDHYNQAQLYIPPPGDVFGSMGGPFLFCEVN